MGGVSALFGTSLAAAVIGVRSARTSDIDPAASTASATAARKVSAQAVRIAWHTPSTTPAMAEEREAPSPTVAIPERATPLKKEPQNDLVHEVAYAERYIQAVPSSPQAAVLRGLIGPNENSDPNL
jgi:hypothetical protein